MRVGGYYKIKMVMNFGLTKFGKSLKFKRRTLGFSVYLEEESGLN